MAQDGHPLGELPLMLAYSSSKSALNAITIAYAKELAHAGIKVNVAAPGYVGTDLPDEGPTGTFAAAGENGKIINLAW